MLFAINQKHKWNNSEDIVALTHVYSAMFKVRYSYSKRDPNRSFEFFKNIFRELPNRFCATNRHNFKFEKFTARTSGEGSAFR